MQQRDVVRDLQFFSALMPPRTVKDENGVMIGRNLGADLDQMPVHHVDVDGRKDERDAGVPSGTNGAENVDPLVPEVFQTTRTTSLFRPNAGQSSLLTDTRLVLPPEFDGLVPRVFRDGLRDQRGEVFLCVSMACGS